MMINETIFLKDYCPPVFNIPHIDLVFDVLAINDVLVTNRMHLQRNTPGLCFLNGEHLHLESIKMDGLELPSNHYQVDEKGLTLLQCPDDFQLEIVTRLNPQNNTALSGLYASRKMLCTQCEAHGFRCITFFADRPDVLSRFTAQIFANREDFPNLLSNGNLIENGILDDGRHYTLWQDPFLKPSYLFALVAGDLACISDKFVTLSHRQVGIDIYVEKGDEHLCHFAMQSIKNAMQWDEQKFGREYDLERYIVVAVKDFNMGAMENKGLNIFNAKYVLADEKTATDDDILAIESVIGHEYFHNWTGNRVTCRDWFQLSLKEGLTIYRDQTFSGDMNDKVVQRILDVSNLRKVQFPEDRGALAHPVQPKSYQEINNFYTATVYEKGGEIVRMYEAILGEDGFRKGMNLYFERHDGQAVTIEDFLSAMADANHYDFKHFKRWYDEVGTPVVNVKETHEHGVLTIEMTQNSKNPLYIPIRWAVYSHQHGALDLPKLLLLERHKQTFQFNVAESDIVVNYLQGFSAPIILRRELNIDQILQLLQMEQDGFALWDLLQGYLIQSIQQSYHEQQLVTLPNELIAILKDWIHQQRHSAGLFAELLRFPSFEECLVGLTNVDAIQLEQFHRDYQHYFASYLHEAFKLAYHQANILELENIGERAWRQVCLNYLSLVDKDSYLPLVWKQFKQPRNMTDQISALKIILRDDVLSQQQQGLHDFYMQWQHQELVMDKWFTLQAQILGLKDVEKLLDHSLFSWINPNKVRAVLGGLLQNYAVFHAKDGSGYTYLADAILKLDRINPQVAARMATPFTRWDWMDVASQKHIATQLQRMLAVNLSPNVSEMISKSWVNYQKTQAHPH
jgi:aminopeptidase N